MTNRSRAVAGRETEVWRGEVWSEKSLVHAKYELLQWGNGGWRHEPDDRAKWVKSMGKFSLHFYYSVENILTTGTFSIP